MYDDRSGICQKKEVISEICIVIQLLSIMIRLLIPSSAADT